MIKLIAIDIDGTLLQSNQKVSNGTYNKLKECEKAGIEWLLVTGRNHDIVTPILEDYNLSCDLILNSGHEYINKENTIHDLVFMEAQTSKNLLEILLAYQYHLSVHTDKGKYIFMSKKEYFNQHIEMAMKKRNSNLDGLKDCALFNKEKFMNNCHEVKNLDEFMATNAKILKIDARNLNIQALHESLPKIKQIKNIVLQSSFESYLEISDNRSNKALMLDKVIIDKHIKKNEVCIFGDSMNDLDLFESYTNTFAMANAINKIKESANWITSSNNEDGVAKGIQFILSELNQ